MSGRKLPGVFFEGNYPIFLGNLEGISVRKFSLLRDFQIQISQNPGKSNLKFSLPAGILFLISRCEREF